MRDADEFIQALAEPIAVVGNGWMRNCHDSIEAHRTIIRFNDFADEGYEPHVGHTCHVWCVTCCGKVRFRDFPADVMTIATIQEQPTFIPPWLDRYPDIAVPQISWIRESRELKLSNPSTGIVLLHRLMKHRKQFTAFGFDGLRSGHYWDVNHDHGVHPDELQTILELAKRGATFV